MKIFHIKTLGCKVNQADSDEIRGEFLRLGWRENRDEAGADVCVVNTCCVTEGADRKSRYAVREAARCGARPRVVVTGCYAGYRRALLEKTPGVSAVFDNEEKSAIVDWVRRMEQGVSPVAGNMTPEPPQKETVRPSKTRAFLKIQDGCDYRCSYCVIPLVRGVSRSRSPEDVATEARRFADMGFQEIVLTGVCLGAYGRDLVGSPDIVDLIASLAKISGIARIRLSSIEASDITDRLLDTMATSSKMCPHLHIPFQSGDDDVLGDMNKRLRVADYLRLTERARGRIDRLTITCDMIVGFPTEGEEQFRNTLSFLQAVRPLKVHIFSYSLRQGTVISRKGKKVADTTIKARYRELTERVESLSVVCRGDFVGADALVLFEAKKNGMWEGYAENYVKVAVRHNASFLKGAIRRVRLKAVAGKYVLGELV